MPAYLKELHNAAGRTAEFLTDATRYHGYREPQAPAALRYQVVEHRTLLQKRDDTAARVWAESRGESLGYPLAGMIGGYLRGQNRRNGKYRHPTAFIFDVLDVCRLVKERGIRIVYFSSYHAKTAVPAESFSAGPLGNVGNSSGNRGLYCRNGVALPSRQRDQADVTYNAMGYSPTAARIPTDNTIHNFAHHLEALFRYADAPLWEKIVGPIGHLERTKVFPGMPGLRRGEVFDQDRAIQRFGVEIELLEMRGDRSSRVVVGEARPLPDLPAYPEQRLPRQVSPGSRVPAKSRPSRRPLRRRGLLRASGGENRRIQQETARPEALEG